ncbi:stalk domain-containing protein [Cellulosilyticum lentocellum]|uniref:Copper amine oxidase-like domain-containing protein n=1 Tax=Cellulosilyticum lentocellum (strain ATCC 49066 / DSM 5427 / NCIMB 11756 / RHM5) TaxID=642492 RepID=F2JIN3_CELLD|nr:stalk domain-containing protein [Cellulosilyticum lentocellum]ADZ85503.1 copper amine oxidase-like domain-containing protein [Cellulosilyticum lentocellum DSM 5427]
MKLRQKLAVALASAMVLTSVPVVTMAASTNTLNRETVMVSENASLTDVATAPQLKIELKDYVATGTAKDVFYLELENAKWSELNGKLAVEDATGNKTAWTEPTGVTVDVINEKEAKVVVDVAAGSAPTLRIPLLTTVKEGDAKVTVKSFGSSSTVTGGTYTFATTSEDIAKVTVGTDIPSFYKSGSIADIVLTEAVAGAFKNSAGKDTIELTIQNDDFYFTGVGTAQLSYGFGTGTVTGIASINTNDSQVLTITLPKNLTQDSIGKITLTGITVASKEKTPETGDLTIDIDGKAVTSQSDVVVAKVADYGNTLSVKDDKAVEIVAGQTKAVEFTLSENVEDSMIANREVEFKLDKGYFALEDADKNEAKTKANLIASINSIKNGKTTLTSDQISAAITGTIVEDKKVVGFTLNTTSSVLATTSIDKITINADVNMGLEESGEATLAVTGRAIGEELTKVVATAKQSIEVKTEAAVLKVGLKGQEAGKITITETEKEMIKKGKDIEITLPAEKGITFAEAPEVKVTGDLQIGKVKLEDVTKDGKVTGQKVTIPVTRTSKTASIIEIANFVIDTDRTVAEGAYDVQIGGEALTALNDTIEATDFITIGTKNTEDLGSNGLRRGTSTFVIGESKYTVDGVVKEMDAKSFIQDPGYTMVPVRYVAEAFGVEGNNILFSNGVATIFAGTRTIQLTNNSDIAIVNGAQIKMATKVVMKDGRTYAPIGEVAQLLGVSKAWDNTTKTATFTNK